MEAKDPAMSPEKIAKHQLLEIIEASKKAGMKEVVKWVRANSQTEKCDPDTMSYFEEYRWIDELDWQAFLKEKEIE